MGRTPRDLAQALEAVARRPTPALVWRDGSERVELSGRVLVNWVEKAAGLLVDELDVTSSDVVTVSPVPHWRLPVIALAALRAGARVDFTHHPEPDAALHAQLETAPDHDAARVAELLRRLRLEDLADANPFTLSGGQKRRLSVATVLAAAPGVLILDEPTFGQDARTWRELVDLLVAELDRGTAVVVVTHDRDLIAALAAEELELGA